MKIRYVLGLGAVLIALIGISVLIRNYNDKPKYALKLVNSFTIPELQNSQSKTVSIAGSDSLLYIVSTSDSLKTWSKAFYLNGKTYPDFALPADTMYASGTVIDFFTGKNQLMVKAPGEHNLHYYSVNGKPNFVQLTPPGMCYYQNAAEWQNTMHYTVVELKDGNMGNVNNLALSYYQQPNGDSLQFQKRLPRKQTKRSHSVFYCDIMLSSLGKKAMVKAEITRKAILVNFQDKEGNKAFQIKRHSWFVFKERAWLWDAPMNIQAGENYLVVTSKVMDNNTPYIDKIYNLKGKYLGNLICPDDKNSSMMEIIGNKMVFFNQTTGTIRIEQISLL